MTKLQNALNRRNRAAQKVIKLEDALYEARQQLAKLEGAVSQAHKDAPEGTLISFGGPEWSIVE